MKTFVSGPSRYVSGMFSFSSTADMAMTYRERQTPTRKNQSRRSKSQQGNLKKRAFRCKMLQKVLNHWTFTFDLDAQHCPEARTKFPLFPVALVQQKLHTDVTPKHLHPKLQFLSWIVGFPRAEQSEICIRSRLALPLFVLRCLFDAPLCQNDCPTFFHTAVFVTSAQFLRFFSCFDFFSVSQPSRTCAPQGQRLYPFHPSRQSLPLLPVQSTSTFTTAQVRKILLHLT